MSASEWAIPTAFFADPRTREHLPRVLRGFGPVDPIVDHVGPAWAPISQPDLFDRPTPRETVARYLVYRIYAAGQTYATIRSHPSVVDTRALLEDFKKALIAIDRTKRRLSHVHPAFNRVCSHSALDCVEDIVRRGVTRRERDLLEEVLRDAWERFDDTIEDAWARLTFLQREDLAAVLGQPAARHKQPETVLWEAIFTLLVECGISPLDKYQPVVETVRAAHRLFGIEAPNTGTFYPAKSKFENRQLTPKQNKKAAR